MCRNVDFGSQRPCVDGNNSSLNRGPAVHRLPLSTPRSQRQQMVAKATAEAAAARGSSPASCRSTVTSLLPAPSQFSAAPGNIGKGNLSDKCVDNHQTTLKVQETPAPVSVCAAADPRQSPRRPQSSQPHRPSSLTSHPSPPVARRRPTTAPRCPDTLESLEFSTWPYFEG